MGDWTFVNSDKVRKSDRGIINVREFNANFGVFATALNMGHYDGTIQNKDQDKDNVVLTT